MKPKFGELMAQYRERMDYTQAELAEKMKLSMGFIQKQESGAARPEGLDFCNKLASKLGLNIMEKQHLIETAFDERNTP